MTKITSEDIESYKIYRHRIHNEDREKHSFIKPEDTHLVCIVVEVGIHQYTSNVVSIPPHKLPSVVTIMLNKVVNAHNNNKNTLK